MDFNSAAKKAPKFRSLPYLSSTLGKAFDAAMVSNLKEEYLLSDEYSRQVQSALKTGDTYEALRKLLEYITATYTDERLEKFRRFLGGKMRPAVFCNAVVESIKGEMENFKSAQQVQPQAQGRQHRTTDDEAKVAEVLPHPQQTSDGTSDGISDGISDSTSDSIKPSQATPDLPTHKKEQKQTLQLLGSCGNESSKLPENKVQSPVQETKGSSPVQSGRLPITMQRAADERGKLQNNMHKAIPSKQASSFHQNDIIPDDPDGVFDSTAEHPSLYGDRSLVGSPQDETITEPCKVYQPTQLVVNVKEDESHRKAELLSPSSQHSYQEPEEETPFPELGGARIEDASSFLPFYQEALDKHGAVNVEVIRTLLVGPSGVGKSSLHHLLVHGESREIETSTAVMKTPDVLIFGGHYAVEESVWKLVTETCLNQSVKKSASDRSYEESSCYPTTIGDAQSEMNEKSTGAGTQPSKPQQMDSQNTPTDSVECLDGEREKLLSDSKVSSEDPIQLKKARFIHMIDSGGQPAFQDVLPLLLAIPCTYIQVFNTSVPFAERIKPTWRPEAGVEQPLEAPMSETHWEFVQRSLSTMQTMADKFTYSDSARKVFKGKQPEFRIIFVGTCRDKIEDQGTIDEVDKCIDSLDTKPFYKNIHWPVHNGKTSDSGRKIRLSEDKEAAKERSKLTIKGSLRGTAHQREALPETKKRSPEKVRGSTDKQGRGPLLLDEHRGTVGQPGGPMDQQVRPMDQQKGPMNQRRELVVQGKELVDRQGGPMDQRVRPMDQQEGPMDQPGGPVDQQEGPLDQPGGPVDQQEGPLDQPGGPMDQQEGPLDQGREPMDQPGGPMDPGREPMDQQGKPMDPGREPMDQQGGPMDQGRGFMEQGRELMDPGKEPTDQVKRKETCEKQDSPNNGRESSDQGIGLTYQEGTGGPMDPGRGTNYQTAELSNQWRGQTDQGRGHTDLGRRRYDQRDEQSDQGRGPNDYAEGKVNKEEDKLTEGEGTVTKGGAQMAKGEDPLPGEVSQTIDSEQLQSHRFFLINNHMTLPDKISRKSTSGNMSYLNELRKLVSDDKCVRRLKVPLLWFFLELVTRKATKKFFRVDDLKEFCLKHHYIDGYNSEKQFLCLLKLHHVLGFYTFFELDGRYLRDNVNYVCTDATSFYTEVSKLLTVQYSRPPTGKAEKFKSTGVIEPDYNVLDDFKINKAEVDYIWFLEVLHHLGIAARLSPDPPPPRCSYFIPSCLPYGRAEIPPYQSVEPLCITFRYKKNPIVSDHYLPRGVFCRLVVEMACKSAWEVFPETSDRTSVIFSCDETSTRMYLSETPNYMSCQIIVDEPFPLETVCEQERLAKLHNHCAAVRNELKDALNKITCEIFGEQFQNTAQVSFISVCACRTGCYATIKDGGKARFSRCAKSRLLPPRQRVWFSPVTARVASVSLEEQNEERFWMMKEKPNPREMPSTDPVNDGHLHSKNGTSVCEETDKSGFIMAGQLQHFKPPSDAEVLKEFFKSFKDAFLKKGAIPAKDIRVRLFDNGVIPQPIKEKIGQAHDDYDAVSLLYNHMENQSDKASTEKLLGIMVEVEGYPQMKSLGVEMRDKFTTLNLH